MRLFNRDRSGRGFEKFGGLLHGLGQLSDLNRPPGGNQVTIIGHGCLRRRAAHGDVGSVNFHAVDFIFVTQPNLSGWAVILFQGLLGCFSANIPTRFRGRSENSPGAVLIAWAFGSGAIRVLAESKRCGASNGKHRANQLLLHDMFPFPYFSGKFRSGTCR